MTDIEKRKYRNELLTHIRDSEVNIKRSEETIKRIKSKSGTSDAIGSNDFINNQMKKLQENIKLNNDKLNNYEYELSVINTSVLDEKISVLYKSQDKEVKEKNNKSFRMKEENKEELNENKKISSSYYNNMRTAAYKEKRIKTDIKYGWTRYCGIVDSIPRNIQRNLKDMPCNRGYIWRGCWCFGEKKAESDIVIMFEKHRGDIFIIHEIDKYKHRIYEKRGHKGYKKLISETFRRIKTKSNIYTSH